MDQDYDMYAAFNDLQHNLDNINDELDQRQHDLEVAEREFPNAAQIIPQSTYNQEIVNTIQQGENVWVQSFTVLCQVMKYANEEHLMEPRWVTQNITLTLINPNDDPNQQPTEQTLRDTVKQYYYDLRASGTEIQPMRIQPHATASHTPDNI